MVKISTYFLFPPFTPKALSSLPLLFLSGGNITDEFFQYRVLPFPSFFSDVFPFLHSEEYSSSYRILPWQLFPLSSGDALLRFLVRIHSRWNFIPLHEYAAFFWLLQNFFCVSIFHHFHYYVSGHKVSLYLFLFQIFLGFLNWCACIFLQINFSEKLFFFEAPSHNVALAT